MVQNPNYKAVDVLVNNKSGFEANCQGTYGELRKEILMKRYQIFISSTYDDLKKERSTVVESILKLRHIPVGMEQFVATNDSQFNYIKRIIDETDYYVLIIGNRYGTIADNGISYTEKEFDYAVSKGIPILAFVHKNPDMLSVDKSEATQIGKEKLIEFKKKVGGNHRLVTMLAWETPDTLAKEVVVALTNSFNDNPRPGWERVSGDDNATLSEQINNLKLENEDLKSQLNEVFDKPGDMNAVNEFHWNDNIDIKGYSNMDEYSGMYMPVKCTWAQLFTLWGIFLIGKMDDYSSKRALEKALFGDKHPYWGIKDDVYQKIKFTFMKIGVIEIVGKRSKKEDIGISISKSGQIFLLRQPVPAFDNFVDENAIVMESADSRLKEIKKLDSLIHCLSEFHSNPEGIYYIGSTLIEIIVFLASSNLFEEDDRVVATKLVDEIINEASYDERLEAGIFDPIFNLVKINSLVKILLKTRSDHKTLS